MIHGAGNYSEYFKVLRDYRNQYKNQTNSLGLKKAFNNSVKFNNKTEVNGEELNTMVKKPSQLPSRREKRNAPEWSKHTSMNLAMKMRISALTTLT